jgi:hypothetical protein
MAAPTAEPRAAARDDRLSEWVADDSRVAVGLHYVSLGVAFVVVAYLCRRYWYFNDDFLVQSLIRDRGVRGVFEPYAEHWMSVPKVLAHLNYAVVGFKTYWPTTVAVLATNTVVGHLLWRVMRQAGLSAWIATGLVAVYLVTPGDATRDIMQVGWFAAVGLGLAAILCVNSSESGRRRELAAAGLVLVAIVCHSGVAVGMVIAVALVALLRRGWRAALVVAVPPVALYLLWLAVIGRDRVQQELPEGVPLGEVPRFVVTELPGTVASPLRVATAVGVIVLVGVGAWLLVRRRDALTNRAPVFAMAAVVVLLFFAVARSRTDVAYRYAYLAWLLFLPALGLVLQDLGRRPARRCVLAIVVSGILGVLGLARMVDVAHGQAAQRTILKHELTEMARRTRTDGFVPEVIVDNERAPLLRAKQVAEWARAGKFPAPSRPPSAGELRNVTARLQVRWVPKPPPSFDAGNRPTVVAVTGTEATRARDGCLDLASAAGIRSLELDVPRRAAVKVEGVRELVVSVPSLGDDGTEATVTIPVIHDDTEYVEFAGGTNPRIDVEQRGPVTVCGVDRPAELSP